MIIVNSENEIEPLSADLQSLSQSGGFITVDTEFIRENIPYLCLIQISTESENYIVDPLFVNIKFLQPFFASCDLRKVFHSSEQDIEILQDCGFELNNVYDTQLYEMILQPREQISYQTIVQNYLGKKLEKRSRLSDWSRRPLSRRQLEYAAADVSYLRDVYRMQMAALKKLHREHWLDEEIRSLSENNLRIRKLERVLSEDTYPILYKLIDWRDQRARKENMPEESQISDRLIKSICRKGLEFVRSLKNSRIADSHIAEFLDYAEQITENISASEINASAITLMNLLKTLLNMKAEEHSVASMVIATSKDLTAFANGDRNVNFLQGWRREIFGNYAEALLEEKIFLGVKDGKVVMSAKSRQTDS